MSSAATPPAVETYAVTIPVTSAGSYVTLGSRGAPANLAIPAAGRRICGWSINTRPSDVNGSVYVAVGAPGGAIGVTAIAAMVAAGTAVRLDPGEILQTPSNVPGPFALDLAITAKGADTAVRLVVHLVNN